MKRNDAISEVARLLSTELSLHREGPSQRAEDALKALIAVAEAAQAVRDETWFRIRSEGTAKALSDALAVLNARDWKKP